MRSISDILMEDREIANLDDFDRNILGHIAIDYCDSNEYYRRHCVLEKYGVYDGLNELVEYIWQDCKRMLKDPQNAQGFQLQYDRNDLADNFSNLFWDVLHIDIDLTEDDGGAYQGNDIINNSTLLFDDVYIDVYTTDPRDIPHIIKHELTHAYHNYNLLLKWDDRFERIGTSQFYQRLDPTEDMTLVQKYVRQLLYFTLDIERNALLAQMTDVLRKHKDKIKTPLDALHVLQNTSIYKAYKRLPMYIEMYNRNKLLPEIAEEIAREYNDICNTNLTTNKVFKKLDFLIKKSNKKLDNVIGKMCLENLNNVWMTIPSGAYLED